MMCNNNDSVPITCKSFQECSGYLDRHFSHLEELDDNIFDPNNTQNDISPFRLTVDPLERLIMTKAGGWLNDVVINQVVHLVNFHAEYEPASKTPGAKLPLVSFGDTSTDNLKLNPRNVMSYKHICDDVPTICEKKCDDVDYSTLFRQEVNTWYSQNGNTLLDKIIAYHDDRK